jgi:hypothetical protein
MFISLQAFVFLRRRKSLITAYEIIVRTLSEFRCCERYYDRATDNSLYNFLTAALDGEITRHICNRFQCAVKFHGALGSSIDSWVSDFSVNCIVLVKQIILH